MIVITVKVDKDSEMACVQDSHGNGMEGNFWDFHNGCHGMYEFNEFNTYNELVNVLKEYHIKNGEEVKIIRETYKY